MGIADADGEYVLFVDVDDYLEENYLEQIEGCVEDIVIMPFKEFYSDGNVVLFNQFGDIRLPDKKELMHFLQIHLSNRIFVAPWGKFIKRKLLDDVKFDSEMKLGEDTVFNFSILRKASSLRSKTTASYMYKAEENFVEKYRLTVEKAIYSIVQTYRVYEGLGIHSSHDRSIFVCFLMLCEEDVVKHPSVWLENKEIAILYHRYKDTFLLKERIKYTLFHHQWIFCLLRKISKKVKPI